MYNAQLQCVHTTHYTHSLCLIPLELELEEREREGELALENIHAACYAVYMRIENTDASRITDHGCSQCAMQTWDLN